MSTSSAQFIDSVLRLRAQIAAFDCDGTLWSDDVGERFFDWEIRERIVSPELGQAMRARYSEYRAGNVAEEQMCAEMVTMNRGLPESKLLEATAYYFEHVFPGKIFLEMREIIARLQDAGCDVWAVSASNEWIIRAAMRHFNIPENRILASAVEIDNGIITDRLIRVPSGAGKPQALREVVEKQIDAAFGNSRFDTEMLAMAKSAFAINPNPDLESVACERGWQIYFPNGTGPRPQ